MAKVERLLNLICILLDTGRPLAIGEIRAEVSGYKDKSDDAFRRMFERDKDDLREMGVPVVLQTLPPGVGEGEGYRIPKSEYRLPDPGLTPEEAAALAIATQAVKVRASDGDGDDFRYAALKFGLEGLIGPEAAPAFVELDLSAGALDELYSAVCERRVASFEYRSSAGELSRREAEPYGITHARGHWYLVARDIAGAELHPFRVDRIQGEVTLGPPGAFERQEGVDVRALADVAPWEAGTGETTAELSFDAGAAWRARRVFEERADVEERADGSLRVSVKAQRPEALIGLLLEYGVDAELIGPPELRQQLVEHVRVCE